MASYATVFKWEPLWEIYYCDDDDLSKQTRNLEEIVKDTALQYQSKLNTHNKPCGVPPPIIECTDGHGFRYTHFLHTKYTFTAYGCSGTDVSDQILALRATLKTFQKQVQGQLDSLAGKPCPVDPTRHVKRTLSTQPEPHRQSSDPTSNHTSTNDERQSGTFTIANIYKVYYCSIQGLDDQTRELSNAIDARHKQYQDDLDRQQYEPCQEPPSTGPYHYTTKIPPDTPVTSPLARPSQTLQIDEVYTVYYCNMDDFSIQASIIQQEITKDNKDIQDNLNLTMNLPCNNSTPTI